jgi:hypothetical protein
MQRLLPSPPHPLLGALALLVALVAGCGPRWTIVAQTSPDPMLGAHDFYIESIHFDPPMVGEKTEAEYQADKSPEQRDSWDADKRDTSGGYAAAIIEAAPALRFVTQPAPGVFIVRPIVSFIEPGFYAGYVSAPTQVLMHVQLLASDGALVDEIEIRSLIGASFVNAASGTRLRQAGTDLGRVTADYLRKRVLTP